MLERAKRRVLQLVYLGVFWLQATFTYRRPGRRDLAALADGPNAADFALERLDHEDEELLFEGSQDETTVFLQVRTSPTAVSALLLLLVGGQKFVLPDGVLRRPRRRSSAHLLDVGPLRLELREPFRRWRITFRGDLRGPDGALCFVDWRAWWLPISDAHFFAGDVPLSVAARHAAASRRSDLFATFQESTDNVQWGVLRGRLLVDGAEPTEVDLRGFRLRKDARPSPVRLENVTTALLLNGERTAHFEFSVENSAGILEFGRRFLPNRHEEPLDSAGKEEVEHLAVHSFRFSNGSSVNLEFSRLLGAEGSGCTWFVEGDPVVPPLNPLHHREYEYTADEFERSLPLLPFTHRACADPALAGGKGANLAKMRAVEHKFVVPAGFVLTVAAFREHLRSHDQLRRFVEAIDNDNNRDFAAIEKKAQELFTGSELNTELHASIDEQLERLFGSRPDEIRFAVRSSAVGEDGAELSSAGQLESILHVERSEICTRVLDCWASNFRREVLTYRWEHNQPLSSPMAVVVQEMIVDGVAGVVFTNDPVRGDPSRVVMNFVEGDGEKLVSGQAIPTQVVISKRDMRVVEQTGPPLLNDDCCLRIAEAAVYLERVFDHPQDVEFVFKSGALFVVQSRNVTGLDLESEWELEHEFDTPALSQKAIFSTANLGEVMPVPLSPLGCSTLAIAYDRTIHTIFSCMSVEPEVIYQHTHGGVMIFRQRAFLNALESLLRNWEDVKTNRIPEYNVAGCRLFTDEQLELGREHFPPKSPLQRGYEFFKMLKMLYVDSGRLFGLLQAAHDEMKLCTVPDDPRGILAAVRLQLEYFVRVIELHSTITVVSSITYVLVAMIMKGDSEGDLDSKLLNAIATVYSNNPHRLISGDIPVSLRKIALAIKSNPTIREQLEMFEDAGEAVAFLRADRSECGEAVRAFLRDHGHRGLHELLLVGRPWGDDHEQLIATVKSMLADPQLEKADGREVIADLSRLVGSLDVPLGAVQRALLKHLIPHAHRSVQSREAAKNLLVHGTSLIRNSFKKLGRRLHEDRVIKQPEVVFQLTLWELEALVVRGDTSVLSRARRRQRVYGRQLEQRYPLVSVGNPEPLEDQASERSEGTTLRLSGTTVCEGRVSGRARVARSLAEAKDTKPNEILITTWTDIAWSPLFPVVGGLVTEIGGLLSHGAVVAREYRLPCLIAVPDATVHFKTGDLVLLDSFKGTIERVDE